MNIPATQACTSFVTSEDQNWTFVQDITSRDNELRFGELKVSMVEESQRKKRSSGTKPLVLQSLKSEAHLRICRSFVKSLTKGSARLAVFSSPVQFARWATQSRPTTFFPPAAYSAIYTL